METKDGIRTLYASSTNEWRKWLNDNCQIEKSVWLIVYHKNSKTASVHWHDAIENALCFGWVDSKATKRDKESCYLKFTPRNPKSKWGAKNKVRALRMIENGLMTRHGQALIDIAKSTAKWDRLSKNTFYGCPYPCLTKKIRRHLMKVKEKRGFGWKQWSTKELFATYKILSDFKVAPRKVVHL